MIKICISRAFVDLVETSKHHSEYIPAFLPQLEILGPDLLIVCLTMSDSERRERVLARHQGDVSTADMMDVSRNVFRPDS